MTKDLWRNRLDGITDLHEFSKFIPEFFSNNGEAHEIRVMYDKLHIEDNAFKKVFTSDLQITRSFYNEYEAGFIRHLNIHAGDSDIIGITSIANDKFLEEIFNGRYNKPAETNLCDAVGNLEVLIDLLPDIDSMISNQNRFSNKECYIAYTDFTIKYLRKMIDEIIDTFYGIEDMINGTKKKSSAYKLFI